MGLKQRVAAREVPNARSGIARFLATRFPSTIRRRRSRQSNQKMKLIDKSNQKAFGWPGIEPRWTHGGKDGVGTAYAASSRIWFTFWNGLVTEVYYPTVDRPQLRTFSTSSPTARAFSTKRSGISNPNWNICRTTAWDTAVRIRIQPGITSLSKRSP